jgi:hypothetical protein
MSNLYSRVLLTGAGFTSNFGAPLASQMWAKILNRLPRDRVPQVRQILLRGDDGRLDFEAAYNEVMASDIPGDEKDALTQTVLSAYDEVDTTILDYHEHSPERGIDLRAVNQLFDQFRGDGSCPGMLFTLNQDLFVERFTVGEQREIVLPGMPRNGHFAQNRQQSPLKEQDLIRLPSSREVKQAEDTFAEQRYSLVYLKLHGSHNWTSEDGKRRLVIGMTKMADIEAEPMLDWYYRLFEKTLCRPETRLLVIGYGFRDPHINKVLLKAAAKFGLRTHIVCPLPPDDLLDMRNGLDPVWMGLEGYYQADFRQLFSARAPGLVGSPDPSREREELYQRFFGVDAPKPP